LLWRSISRARASRNPGGLAASVRASTQFLPILLRQAVRRCRCPRRLNPSARGDRLDGWLVRFLQLATACRRSRSRAVTRTIKRRRAMTSFQGRIVWTRVAIAAVLTISTAGAQARRGGVAEPYTPAADAKDLKAVLFRWMWGMGMLKGHDERDMVASLEYQGKGTIQVDGQPCTLTKYRVSTNYQTFSERTQYTCSRANGQTDSNIEVVSGLYAWNEDTPGAQIGSTKGKTTPTPAAAQERLIRFWASPQGAAKAAVAGTTDTFWLGANPGTLFPD